MKYITLTALLPVPIYHTLHLRKILNESRYDKTHFRECTKVLDVHARLTNGCFSQIKKTSYHVELNKQIKHVIARQRSLALKSAVRKFPEPSFVGKISGFSLIVGLNKSFKSKVCFQIAEKSRQYSVTL